MMIHGFNKLTLLDYPGYMACTIFTGGCNFRCPFCHNASLVLTPADQPVISVTEIISYLKKRKGIIEGVCITGGEPLLEKDLSDLLCQIKSLGLLIKLDTNGSFPDLLLSLIKDSLIDYVAMDIKNSLEHYCETIGIERFDTKLIERSADILMNSRIPYEFRTTVVSEYHSLEDFLSISKWLQGANAYYLQPFVDSGDLIISAPGAQDKNNIILHGYSTLELFEVKNILSPHFSTLEIRGL